MTIIKNYQELLIVLSNKGDNTVLGPVMREVPYGRSDIPIQI